MKPQALILQNANRAETCVTAHARNLTKFLVHSTDTRQQKKSLHFWENISIVTILSKCPNHQRILFSHFERKHEEWLTEQIYESGVVPKVCWGRLRRTFWRKAYKKVKSWKPITGEQVKQSSKYVDEAQEVSQNINSFKDDASVNHKKGMILYSMKSTNFPHIKMAACSPSTWFSTNLVPFPEEEKIGIQKAILVLNNSSRWKEVVSAYPYGKKSWLYDKTRCMYVK